MENIFKGYVESILNEQFIPLQRSRLASMYQNMKYNDTMITTIKIPGDTIDILYGSSEEDQEIVVLIRSDINETSYWKIVKSISDAKNIAMNIYKDIATFEDVNIVVKKYKLTQIN